MKQKFGKYTVEITVTGDTPDESKAREILTYGALHLAVRILLRNRTNITEEDILQGLAEQKTSPLTEDEISKVKEILAELHEAGALTVNENGYYS